MRVLVLTRIFPNAFEPLSSPFNRQQLAALAKRCDVEVIAPVPWFPGARAFGPKVRAAKLASLGRFDRIDGVAVEHPPGLYLPRIGVPAAVPLLWASVRRAALQRRGRFDVLLGAWIYPDACAALLLADELGIPCVVKAHGSDVNEIARRIDVRPIVRRMLPRAAAALAPSRGLVAELSGLGVPPRRCFHVPNGVDAAVFRPRDRAEARRLLRVDPSTKLVVFVGRLVREKGLLELLAAMRELPHATLAVVGGGPLEDAVRARAAEDRRVLAVGQKPLADVATWVAASDVVALPSWMEGSPNAVLEALASGRPVVATRVGGIPEVVAPGQNGELVPPREPEALARALERALARDWDPAAVASSGPPTWEASSRCLEDVLHGAVHGGVA